MTPHASAANVLHMLTAFLRHLFVALALVVASAPCAFATTRNAPPAAVDPWKRHAAFVEREDEALRINDLSEADRIVDSALTVARATHDAGLERVALYQRARGMAVRFQLDSAAVAARHTLELGTQSRDTVTMLRSLRLLASICERRGQVDEGLRLCARGALLAKRLGLPREIAVFELRRGYLMLSVRHDREARDFFRSSLKSARKANHELGVMQAYSGLGDAYQRLRQPDSARAAYSRAVALARKREDPTQQVYLLLNLSRMESDLGDPDRAPGFAIEAYDVAHQFDLTSFALSAVSLLAQFEVARGAWGRVDSIATANLPLAEPIGDRDPLANLLLTKANALIEMDRSSEAEPLIRRAMALTDSMTPAQAAFHTHNIVYEQYHGGQSAMAVQTADDQIARLSRRMPGESLYRIRFYRALALLRLKRTREALSELRQTVAITRPIGGEPAGAENVWALAELGIAHHDLAQMDSSVYFFRAAIRQWEHERSTATLEELLADSEDMGTDIGFSYAHALLDARRGRTAAVRTIEAFTEMQRFHALALSERLLGPATGAGAKRKPFDFALWRSATLRPGEVFVDVTVNDDSTLVLAVTRRDVRAWMLPGKKSLEKRLGRFSEMLSGSGSDEATLRGVAAALGAEVFGPGADLFKNARGVLLSGGRLDAFPLGALIVPGMNNALALEREVSLVPSATLLGVVRSRTGARPAMAHALVAVARTADDRGRRLSGAGDEVRALGRAYGGTLALVDPRRTAAQLTTEALSRGSVVHLAAHASVDARRPWMSRLLLGDPARRGAYLPVSGISRLKLSAKLCVVASCRSLGGGGEDNSWLQGLGPAWLMAGVPTVVASQWDVDDRATAEFMRRFYTALSSGGTVGGSLRTAQLGMRATTEWTAPRFWAGFVVLGDPGTRVALAARR